MQSKSDLVVLSHHKCATNWLRAICRSLGRRGLVSVDVSNGAQQAGFPSSKAGLPHVHLDVNATRSSALQHLHPKSANNIHFVRDPRDALVSNYFSWRYSHKVTNEVLAGFRARASAMTVEDGMIAMIQHFAMGHQLSNWTRDLWDRTVVVRYEDLIADFAPTVRAMFAPAGLVLDRNLLDQVARETAFKTLSGTDRDAGEEDVESHFRKGLPGDWKNHFTPKLAEAFDAEYGWLGQRLGYW